MSEAEQRHRTTISPARSRAPECESALLQAPAPSGPISTSRPSASATGVRVILLGEPSGLLRELASELARSRMVVEIAAAPEAVVQSATAPRTLIFVDLGTPTDASTAQLASWREQLPQAIWIALTDEFCGVQVARLLTAGVTTIPKPIAASVLAELAHSLAQQPEPCPASSVEPRFRAGGDLTLALDTYSGLRALSRQQRLILGLYLGGSNDKAIAEHCGCSEATVYEHWRRMAKKAGGTHKADAINDFHRFLAGT